MNTDAYYERRLPHPAAQDPNAALTEAELSALARLVDAERADRPDASGRSQSRRSIAWVRPSELVATVASPTVRRGADLQAELGRRARRAPAAATRASRRVTRSSIARPEQTSPTQEGLGL